MGKGNFYMNLNFWQKLSNCSISICGLVLISKMFFRKYIEDIIWPILFVGIFAFLLFVIAELMHFILKKKEK